MNSMQKIDMIEEMLMENLGNNEFLLAITKALDYDTKEDIYEYIARQYDLMENYREINDN